MPMSDEERREAGREKRRALRNKRLEQTRPPKPEREKPKNREDELAQEVEDVKGERDALRATLRQERERRDHDLREVRGRNTKLVARLAQREKAEAAIGARRIRIPDTDIAIILPELSQPGDILVLPNGRYKVGDDGVSLYHVGSF